MRSCSWLPTVLFFPSEDVELSTEVPSSGTSNFPTCFLLKRSEAYFFFFCYLFINSHSLSLSLNASILCLVLGAKIASNYTGNCNTVPDHPWLQREWLSYRGANVLNRKYTQRLIPYNAHSIVPPNGVSEEACITGFSCGKNKLDFFGYFFMVSRLHQRKTFFTALHTGRNRWKLYPRPPHWFHRDQGCALGRTVPAQQSSQLPDKLNHPLLFQNICFSLCKVY